MTSKLHFQITRWTAWAPGIDTFDAWQAWSSVPPQPIASSAAPKSGLGDAAQRRRASQLSRVSLEAARRCLPEGGDIRTVFASRHGECAVAQMLLETLAADELLSPLAFSLSVHNTAAGLYSIATQDRAPSSSIAANKETLCAAMLEALGMLAHRCDQPVLLVVADELVPVSLRDAIPEPLTAYAFAALISPGTQLSLELDASGRPTPRESTYPQPLMFIRWLLGQESRVTFGAARLSWHFDKGNISTAALFCGG